MNLQKFVRNRGVAGSAGNERRWGKEWAGGLTSSINNKEEGKVKIRYVRFHALCMNLLHLSLTAGKGEGAPLLFKLGLSQNKIFLNFSSQWQINILFSEHFHIFRLHASKIAFKAAEKYFLSFKLFEFPLPPSRESTSVEFNWNYEFIFWHKTDWIFPFRSWCAGFGCIYPLRCYDMKRFFCIKCFGKNFFTLPKFFYEHFSPRIFAEIPRKFLLARIYFRCIFLYHLKLFDFDIWYVFLSVSHLLCWSIFLPIFLSLPFNFL